MEQWLRIRGPNNSKLTLYKNLFLLIWWFLYVEGFRYECTIPSIVLSHPLERLSPVRPRVGSMSPQNVCLLATTPSVSLVRATAVLRTNYTPSGPSTPYYQPPLTLYTRSLRPNLSCWFSGQNWVVGPYLKHEHDIHKLKLKKQCFSTIEQCFLVKNDWEAKWYNNKGQHSMTHRNNNL